MSSNIRRSRSGEVLTKFGCKRGDPPLPQSPLLKYEGKTRHMNTKLDT